ncbi:GH92 family glycosyl hydrolase [Constantimarinum furrinae]|uniref:Glycosyl hydrolase family 92 n=1 Tax=Constantimarinum furrinae TaxID=2562285 RepID=A0A7G8PTV5_9FLAO|nr:GH92 family glycosyl hydrolase [Constantimarinum furrinae]QNJ97771.1 Glycosyl hydrolase family 92 [Constantimarinum furrinae]
MRNYFFLLLSFILFSACYHIPEPEPAIKDRALIEYVNPFIGTGGHGHTYPGASMPFGMMQLSPDTRLEGWDGCSGYHYSDNYIYGFSHTHLSGTGVSDYGDVLLMPTNSQIFHNGADGKKGYRAHFSHENETASPGYYRVRLDSVDIEVELTVTKRAGMHKYSYPSSKDQHLIIDLEHRDKLLDFDIKKINDTEFSGFRHSKAWAEDQRLFFYLKFSHPTKQPTFFHRSPDRRNRMAGLEFDNPENEPVYISVGISAVSVEGAKLNLETEIGTKSFEQIKNEAEIAWEEQLEKIVIESPSDDYKTIFYTSLYHSMLAPNLYQDVDGKYRGMDLEIHQTTDFDYYTVFSLWDTYRAAHPLYTIIEQERTNDFINTFLAKYDEGGIMPIWDLSANYTGCMIGYHAVPVIADAYLKGIRGYDAEKAFTAMKHSAMQDKLGLKAYKKFGYIPVEEESESTSKTLEYAYDDWTIAQMAKAMNKEKDYVVFTERAQNYKNIFNPESNFMQGRFRNTWFSPFDPYEVNFNYTEANAWQYSLYVPQDISGLIKLMGGKEAFKKHLDDLFTAKTETSGRDQADITGLIGQYAHGNEPSHHMAYLYNFVNKPYITQDKVHKILTELYTNSPDGISGNEDCGQMSAWYVLSSLGFYPVTPGSNQYIIGTPLYEKATINLESGKQFTIEALRISAQNKYIKTATLNGEPLERSYLKHDEIINGGALVFEMTSTPSNWGTEDANIPKTSIEDALITPAPFIAMGEVAFKNSTEVVLEVASDEAEIYYSINDSVFRKYTQPIPLSEESVLKTYAENNGIVSSTLTTKFYKIDPNLSIRLETAYANQYNAGGTNALIDGIRGARDFRTGAWQGYQDTDLIAIVDLGSVKPIETISVNFLQDQRSWIFYPTQVACYVSDDPKTFTRSLPSQQIPSEVPSEETEIKTLSFDLNGNSGRYIKIVAKNLGDLPQWHLGAPFNGKAWIFVDEIEIK